MNDNYRLLKLLSLVAWVVEGRCGLKFKSEVDEAHLNEDMAAALHNVCMWYAGAVKHYRDGSHVDDAQQLPERTLEAVAVLPSDVIEVLGGMVKQSLGLLGRADAAALGRLWLEDVTATSWRLVLFNKAELWGSDVDGLYAQPYIDRPPHTP